MLAIGKPLAVGSWLLAKLASAYLGALHLRSPRPHHPHPKWWPVAAAVVAEEEGAACVSCQWALCLAEKAALTFDLSLFRPSARADAFIAST